LAETSLYGVEEVKNKYGLEPHQMVDYKSLTGDPSDNVPGIAGVGPKRRRELLKYFGGIAAVEKAGVGDLMRVPSINRKVAEAIYSSFHNG